MPHYVLSLLDVLRAERLRARAHFLSFYQAPQGKAAVCLNCGATFDTYEESEGACAGVQTSCGADPVPGAVPIPPTAVPMLERCFRHQHPEAFGKMALFGASLPPALMPRGPEAQDTPSVYDGPSDRGIDHAALGGM